MSTHMLREIERLKKSILALSAIVEENVRKAVTAISERNPDLAREVIQVDSEIDRMEMDLLLAQWELWEKQLEAVEERIKQEQRDHPTAPIVATMPGAGAYGSLALACRIGPIERFARAGSLANYWGLTPGCRNSGEATDRLGSITKQGSSMARFLLGQMVLHVLRKDAYLRNWYRRIKKRRGSKIARVAVMRRLATILWHMVKYKQPYMTGGPQRVRKMQAAVATFR